MEKKNKMIRIGFYFEPTNSDLKGYFGLYGGAFLVDYMQKNKELNKYIKWFFKTTDGSLDVECNEENLKKMIELYHKLKSEKWEGTLRVYTDDEKVELPDFTFKGFDIGADS